MSHNNVTPYTCTCRSTTHQSTRVTSQGLSWSHSWKQRANPVSCIMLVVAAGRWRTTMLKQGSDARYFCLEQSPSSLPLWLLVSLLPQARNGCRRGSVASLTTAEQRATQLDHCCCLLLICCVHVVRTQHCCLFTVCHFFVQCTNQGVGKPWYGIKKPQLFSHSYFTDDMEL